MKGFSGSNEAVPMCTHKCKRRFGARSQLSHLDGTPTGNVDLQWLFHITLIGENSLDRIRPHVTRFGMLNNWLELDYILTERID